MFRNIVNEANYAIWYDENNKKVVATSSERLTYDTVAYDTVLWQSVFRNRLQSALKKIPPKENEILLNRLFCTLFPHTLDELVKGGIENTLFPNTSDDDGFMESIKNRVAFIGVNELEYNKIYTELLNDGFDIQGDIYFYSWEIITIQQSVEFNTKGILTRVKSNFKEKKWRLN